MGTHTLSTYHSGGITLTNAGSYLSAFTITQTGTIVTAYPPYGVNSTITNPQLLNEGNVNAGGDGVQFLDGGAVTNSTDATISSGQYGIDIAGEGSSGTVLNQGTIFQTGPLGDAGVFLDPSAVLTSSGTVVNMGTASAIFASGGGHGVWAYATTGTVLNQGTISAANNEGVLLEVSGAGIVTNIGTASAIAGYGTGVDIELDLGTVVNAGTISAVLEAGNFGVGIVLEAGGYVANNGTSALIYGPRDGVDIYGSLGTVVNSGTIAGGGEGVISRFGVYLADGGYVTNSGTGALISGAVSYGVVIKGLAGTVLNDGTIYGAVSGVSLLEGSLVSNIGTSSVITGGHYGVRVASSTGTVVNAGTISGIILAGVYIGASGYVLNAGTAAAISGYSVGVSFASSGGAGTVINRGTILGTDTLHGLGVILSGGYVMNSGTASGIFGGDVGVIIASSSSRGTVVNDGTISGAGGYGVQLDAGGIVTNIGTSALISGGIGGVDARYLHGGSPSTVINEGTIAGALAQPGFGYQGRGIVLGNGGYVANNGKASLVEGYDRGVDITSAAGTVINSGNITVTGTAGIGVFLSGGYVANRSMITGGASLSGAGVVSHVAVVAGVEPPPATVVNDATISGGGWGVELQAGSVTNSGTASMIYGGHDGVYIGLTSIVSTVWNEGTIAGFNYGVALATPGRITNSGTAAVILARSTAGGSGIRTEGYAVSVLNAGTISGNGGVDLNAGGTITNTSTGQIFGRGTHGYGVFIVGNGTVQNSGTISGGAYAVKFDPGADSVQNFGTISGGTFGVSFDGGENTVDNFGRISGGTFAVRFNGGDDRVIAHPGAVFTGTVEAPDAATATLELAGTSPPMGTITGIGSQIIGFPTIQFDSFASWLAAGNFTGFDNDTIILLGSLDVIDVTDFKADVDTTISLDSEGVLAIAGTVGANAATLDLTFSSADIGDVFTITPDGTMGTDIFLCFCAGTRIATPDGATAVEDLRPGDMVRTASGIKPVRWIGESPVATRFADPLRALPIRICAGALGRGLPRRDLLLSPDHAIFLAGILVQAGALVNGETIFRDKNVPPRFTYYHVELATHELLLAEGVLAESFVDNVDRMHFANWDARCAPAEPIPEMQYPRAKAARQVPRSLSRMLATAAA
jgi:hypothetical protein